MTYERADAGMVGFAVNLFAALAHPTRYRMVEELAQGEHTVGDIAQRLGITQPNASQHLAILQRAGAVQVMPQGASRVYSIRGPRIVQVLALVNEFRKVHAERLEKDEIFEPSMDGIITE